MAGHGHQNWELEGATLVLGLVAVAVVGWRLAHIAKTRVVEAEADVEAAEPND